MESSNNECKKEEAALVKAWKLYSLEKSFEGINKLKSNCLKNDYRYKLLLANFYFGKEQFDSALYFFNDGLMQITSKNDTTRYKLISEINYKIGWILVKTNQFDKARAHLNRTIALCEKLNDKKKIAEANLELIKILFHSNKVDSALHYADKTIDIATSINDSSTIAIANLLSAYCFLAIHKNKQAFQMANISSNYFYSKEDFYNLPMALTIQWVSLSDENIDDRLKMSMKVFENSKVNNGQKVTLNEVICNYFISKNKLIEAEKYIANAFYYANKIKNIPILLESDLKALQSELLYKQGKHEEAIVFAKEALELIDSSNVSGFVNGRISLFKNLAELHLITGKPKLAKEYYDMVLSLKDTVFSNEMANSISELKIKYESEKKDNQINIEKGEKERQESLNKIQSKYLRVMLIASTIILILLIIYIMSNFQKKKINSELNVQTKIIEKNVIQMSVLLMEIHHRVKNSLQLISSLLELQTDKEDNLLIKESLNQAKNRVASMALIHQKLYQNDNLSVVNMQSYIMELTTQCQSVFGNKLNIDVKYNVQSIFLDIDTATPLGLILCELITNAFKYAYVEKRIEKNELYIALTEKEKGSYLLVVSDNGIGTDTLIEKKKEKGIGIGIIRRLTEQLYGEVICKIERGYTYQIHFFDSETRNNLEL